MRKFLFQIIAAVSGLWLASLFVPGVEVKILPDSNFFGFNLNQQWYLFVLLGIILGLLNFFVKPILDIITLPLRILTLGLFSFVINGVLLWIVDVMFEEFSAPLIYPLLWTTIIIWGLSTVSSILIKKES